MRELLREMKVPTPRRIYEHLDRYVIGQDRAKRAIAIAAYNHRKRVLDRASKSRLLKKSNILLIGPTGCGKTHIARNLAEVLGVPFTVVNATEYTEAGYYGKDVEVMIAELLYKTGGDVEATQQGIVFVDEIDKIARRGHGARTGAGSRDIGGEGVQQALLKMMEGGEMFVPLNVTQHWNKHDFVLVDTTDVLFICAGTFSDLNRGRHARGIGFGRGVERQAASPGGGAGITLRDLEEYGLLAEFLGRVPVVVELHELGEGDLVRILTEPPDAIVREYRELLALDEIDLDLRPDALAVIAGVALDRGLGARGLRAVFEEIFRDVMFDAPERAGTTVRVDPAYVRERLTR
jgi:ATP-dependent Clp protease ATP-binding subunit ClpX